MLACCRLPVRAPMTGLRSIRGLVTAQPLAREAPHCGADRLRLAATQRPISTLFASTCRRRAVHGSSNPNRPTVPLHSTLEAAGAPSKPKAVPRLLSCGYRAWYKHHHSRLKQLFKEHGKVGIGVYSALYVSVFGGFYTCAVHGMDITKLFSMVGLERYADKVDPTAGNLLVAYAATTITGPLRMFVTFAATPAISRRLPALVRFFRR